MNGKRIQLISGETFRHRGKRVPRKCPASTGQARVSIFIFMNMVSFPFHSTSPMNAQLWHWRLVTSRMHHASRKHRTVVSAILSEDECKNGQLLLVNLANAFRWRAKSTVLGVHTWKERNLFQHSSWRIRQIIYSRREGSDVSLLFVILSSQTSNSAYFYRI